MVGSAGYAVFIDFIDTTFVVDSGFLACRISPTMITISDKGAIIGSSKKTELFLAEWRPKSIAKHLAAAIVVTLSLSAVPADAGQRMMDSEIKEAFRGITLDGVYDDETFFSETYFDDGSIIYRDPDHADVGDWSVRDDMFCTFYEAQQGACFFVFREGANCFVFFEPIEDPSGELVPSDRWTSRGWNRQNASSCMKPPEASV